MFAVVEYEKASWYEWLKKQVTNDRGKVRQMMGYWVCMIIQYKKRI